MDLKIKGKRALVLGASTGLGRAVAQALIQEGVTVAISSRSQDKLDQTAREIGAAAAIACDLGKPGAVAGLIQATEKRLGGIDILVTNTGGPPRGSFEQTTSQQWQEGFQSLWLGATESIQAVLPGMKERKWGRILLVTSFAAKEPMPNLTVSNGLRAGLLGLAKSISHEIAPFGITINCLLPGYTDTDRIRELKTPLETIAARVPAGRIGRPEEFGALAAFLASEPAGYITGQSVACDGGVLRSI
jgi:3-oxoacyl-[acyl-carrier protein] reductase